ncbi:hypothetical protein NXY31_25550 [Bacteroides salyersiae]|nr:hypothetical protein [Bacteroides salyersiae]
MKKNYYIFIQMFLFVSLTCFQVNAQQNKPERNKTEKVGTPEATKFQVPATRATMLGTLPYSNNFDSYEIRTVPEGWVCTGEKDAFAVTTFNGWKEIYSEPNCLGAYSSATEDNWPIPSDFR